MRKTIVAIAAHAAALIGLIAWFGWGRSDAPPDIAAPPPEEIETQAPAPDSKFTGEPERNATLRVLENDTAIRQGYFALLLEAFNAEYAEYGITAVDASMDQYLDLENDGPYGYGPDVLYQANDMIMKHVEGQHIQPLPAETLGCFGQVDERAWQAYRDAGGVCYGVPVNIQAPVLYYRRDLLPDDWEAEWDRDHNGIPDIIEYWADLYRFSLLRRGEGGYGYMKALYDVYFASGFLFSYGGYVFGNNGNDASDVGFAGGSAEQGAFIIKQLAGLMNEDCIDTTINNTQYSKIASGEYFCTITTPDVYTMFVRELELAGVPVENLVVTSVPRLPASGDLTDTGGGSIPCVMMGGVNGYAVSSYTKYPNAALAFVDFATGYEMVMKRHEMLGIVPARADAARETGGLSLVVYETLAAGNLALMPSIRQVAQIWTPMETLFSDIAKDAFRPAAQQKYVTPEDFKQALIKANRQVYDAIWTLN